MVAATLVYHRYAFLLHTAIVHDIALGTFADGNDMVSLLACAMELPLIQSAVYRWVVFRVAQEDKVVYGDHRRYAGASQSFGQFTAQSGKQCHLVALQVVHYAVRAPPVGSDAVPESALLSIATMRIDEAQVPRGADTLSQMVMPSVGGIEQQFATVSHTGIHICHQSAAVIAQSSGIPYYTLGVISYSCHISK